MVRDELEIDDTPTWRIQNKEKGPEPVLVAWYTGHVEKDFLSSRTFGTKKEAEEWLEEFWYAIWRL